MCMELSHATGVQVDKDTDTPCATLHKYRWTKTLTHLVHSSDSSLAKLLFQLKVLVVQVKLLRQLSHQKLWNQLLQGHLVPLEAVCKVAIQHVTRTIGKWKVESFPLDEAFTGPHAEADGAQGVDAEKFCVVVVICTISLKDEIADF